MRRLATIGVVVVLALAGLAFARAPDDRPPTESHPADVSERAAKPSPGAAAPPTPPQPYRVPARAIRVRTAAQLEKALRTKTPRDIVLEDGVYARK
jgi:hypothetical protein